MNIEELRKEIDAVDSLLTELFEKRMKIAAKIAQYKKDNNLSVCDKSREAAVLERINEKASDEMKSYVEELYKKIFELSRSYQEKLIEKPEG